MIKKTEKFGKHKLSIKGDLETITYDLFIIVKRMVETIVNNEDDCSIEQARERVLEICTLACMSEDEAKRKCDEIELECLESMVTAQKMKMKLEGEQ